MKLWPDAPPEPGRLAEAQCPNCGSYADPVGSMRREWSTGRTFEQSTALDRQTSSIVLLVSVLGGALLGNLLPGGAGLWIGLTVGVILALAAIGWTVARNVSREARSSRVVVYKCRRCLHQWEQEEGKPAPRYNERQEILADYRASYREHEAGNGDDKPRESMQ